MSTADVQQEHRDKSMNSIRLMKLDSLEQKLFQIYARFVRFFLLSPLNLLNSLGMLFRGFLIEASTFIHQKIFSFIERFPLLRSSLS